MIDYEKLKLTMEMVKQLAKPAIITINVTHGDIERVYGVLQYDYSLLEAKHMGEFKFTCIEHLIDKLTELTKPEPKYKEGSSVYFLHHENIEIGVTDGLSTYNDCNIYHVLADGEGFTIGEGLLFPTRQALIEHQIEYWYKMSCENGHHEFIDDATGYKSICVYCNVDECNEIKKCAHPARISQNQGITYNCEICGALDVGFPNELATQSNQPQVDIRINQFQCSLQETYPSSPLTINISGRRCGKSQVDVDRCQHELDGFRYISNPPQNKCIKCGEFYR